MANKFNGLIDAVFLPPRNWVLNKPLTFTCEELTANWSIMLKECGVEIKGTTIVVPSNYITDLASVPRACWAFIAPFDVARAAIVHDILYEKINVAFKNNKISDREPYRLIADTIFKLAMKCSEPEVPSWKIWSAHTAVRLFGKFAIKSSGPREPKFHAYKKDWRK